MKDKIKKILKFQGIYTVLFLLLAFLLFQVFQIENKSFVWASDGIAQHSIAIKYIREYIINFFTTGKFPMVDFSLGQGFDIIGTLNYYGFGDPLMLLTILFPETMLEEMYMFLIFARLYLAGSFFAYYCYVIGRTKYYQVLPGALLYAFCNFAIIGGVRHPLFLNGIMFLPLILIGVEKIIRSKKIYFLGVVVAFSFITNYYFTYINTLIAALYFFVRLYGRYKEYGLKKNFIYIRKIICSYIVGILMSAVILIPSVLAFLNNSRYSKEGSLPIFYSAKYYVMLMKGLILEFGNISYWSLPGIGAIGVIGVLIVILSWKKRERNLVIGFIIGIVMLCLPIVGKIMNGFSYITARFSYGMAFLLSLLIVVAIDDIKDLTKKKTLIFDLLVCAVIIGSVIGYFTSKYPMSYIGVIICLALVLIIVNAFVFMPMKKNLCIVGIVILAVAMFSISFNFVMLYSSKQLNVSIEFANKGQVINSINNPQIKMAKSIKDKSFYRVEKDRDRVNGNLANNINGTNFYYSVVPRNIQEMYSKVCLSNYGISYGFYGQESRMGVMSLSSTKYYVTTIDKNIPFGFKLVKSQNINNEKICLYKNNYSLPLGVTYDSCISITNFEKMEPEKREQALLTAAVVDTTIDGISVFNGDIKGIIRTPFEVVKKKTKHFKIKNNKIKTTRKGIGIYKFKGLSNCENHIVFKNCVADDNVKDKFGILVYGNSGFDHITIRGSLLGKGNVRDSMIANIGYSKNAQNWVGFKHNIKRIYRYDSAYVAQISAEEFAKRVKKLKMNSLEKVYLSTNKIIGNINCDKDKILQLSIPYSTGWTAYVDGHKVDTFASSIAYTGLKVTKGAHKIKLVYTTPGLRIGAIISLLSVICLIAYYFIEKAMVRKKMEKINVGIFT